MFIALLPSLLAMTAGCVRDAPEPSVIRPHRPGWLEQLFSPKPAPQQSHFIRPERHITAPEGPLETVSIRLERGPCFGPCPIYTVELRGTGDVVYEGGCFTMISGRRAEKIDPQAVAELVAKFRKADFWSLRNRYRARVTDHATYLVTISVGGRTKSVEDYVGKTVGMPPEVSDLEDAIDEASHSQRWTSSDVPTLRALEAGGSRFDGKVGARMLALARLLQRQDIASFLQSKGAPELGADAAFACTD